MLVRRAAANGAVRARGLSLIALLALAAIGAACFGDDDEPAVSPSSTATIEATAQPSPNPTSVAADLELPEGCSLFDEAYRDPRAVPGEPTRIEQRASNCAATTLEGVAALLVEWTVPGVDVPPVSAVLTPALEPRMWTASVTFPERGSWRPTHAGGFFIDIFAADFGLTAPSPDLPVSGVQHTVAILDGAATKVLRSFRAEDGGIGFLRQPDRAVFVQAREGGRWLVTADLATGEIESLFEVGPFANVVSAPDGRAVAVEWGTPVSGVRQLRIVTAEGDVAAIDDGSINHINLTWAPDSSALLAGGDSLWVLAPDGSVRLQRPEPGHVPPLPVWSPDSSFVLLRPNGGDATLVRLDAASLDEEAVLRSDPALGVYEIVVAPDAERVAVLWRPINVETWRLSVAMLDELSSATLEGSVVASFNSTQGLYVGVGALSWSPDGRRLAIGNVGLPDAAAGSDVRSTVAVVDLGSGEVRVVAEAADFYAGSLPRWRAWSADGSTLFVLRFNCTACEPSSSSVDVIDVAAGRVVETFEDAGFVGMTAEGEAALLSTRAGLVRYDAREPLVPHRGGIYFGPQAVSFTAESGEAFVAVRVGVSRGQQIFAAQPDGADVEALGVLPLERQLAGLLDAETAVVRGDDGWRRVDLEDGVAHSYAGSSAAPEKTGFFPSPSGRLTVDVDPEGFAILDAGDPAGAPLVPRRPYPGDVVALPAWSPDESRVAFGDRYTIGVFDLEAGRERVFEIGDLGLGLSRDDPFDRLWAIAWTPDGALEFATRSALWRIDVDAGTAAKVIDSPRPGGFTQGTRLAYSPDGRTLAAATQFGVFVLGEDGAWRELSPLGVGVGEGALRWAPDSLAVAFTAEAAHSPEGIIVAPLDGAPYRLVAPGAVRLLDWLPDGRVVWVSATGGV